MILLLLLLLLLMMMMMMMNKTAYTPYCFLPAVVVRGAPHDHPQQLACIAMIVLQGSETMIGAIVLAMIVLQKQYEPCSHNACLMYPKRSDKSCDGGYHDGLYDCVAVEQPPQPFASATYPPLIHVSLPSAEHPPRQDKPPLLVGACIHTVRRHAW